MAMATMHGVKALSHVAVATKVVKVEKLNWQNQIEGGLVLGKIGPPVLSLSNGLVRALAEEKMVTTLLAWTVPHLCASLTEE